MLRRGVHLRVLALAFVAAACTTAPTAPPSALPSAQSSPGNTAIATPAPSGPEATDPASTGPAPSATSPLAAAWELSTGLGNAAVLDVAHGSQGWVAVGSTCAECATPFAAAWLSKDGLSWTGGTIAGDVAGQISTVATDGSAWFAAGVTFEDDGGNAGLTRARIWRSADAVTWSLVDTIPLGRCFSGCPSIGKLAAGPGGVILSWVQIVGAAQSTAYWSPDGNTWSPIDKARLGLAPDAPMYASAATVAGGRFVIAGGVCEQCGTIWSSADGQAWTVDANLGPAPPDLDVTTDGRRIVLVERDCMQNCTSGTWTAADGRTGWTRAPAELPLMFPRVTHAANLFVVAGHASTGGIDFFVSPDGTSWTRVEDQLSVPSECGVTAIVGTVDRLLLVGGGEGGGPQDGCFGIWVSRAPAST